MNKKFIPKQGTLTEKLTGKTVEEHEKDYWQRILIKKQAQFFWVTAIGGICGFISLIIQILRWLT